MSIICASVHGFRFSPDAGRKRLQTDRIDLYWVHFADGATPIDEIVRGFDDLVRAGKACGAQEGQSTISSASAMP